MLAKPDECRGCPLYERGKGFSVPDGSGSSGVWGIGEALGKEEYMDGKPFRPYAQAGSKLNEAIRLAAEPSRPVTRDMFRFWNVVACQPPGNRLEGTSYGEGAITHCRRHFDRVLNGSSPISYSSASRVLVAYGNVPLKELVGVSGEAGEKQSIKFLRGYVFTSKYGWVIPSYHPAFVKRGNPQLTALLVEDIQKALKVARGEWQGFRGGRDYAEPRYQTGPSLDEVKSFAYRCRDNSQLAIACDIETPSLAALDEDEREGGFLEDPVMIQFSLGKKEGIAFPWKEPYIKAAKWILRLGNDKLGFNWYNFDSKILKARGCKIRGVQHDLMWMWEKWHPRLDRNLQSVAASFYFPFAWKHLYMKDLAWYGCADVDSLWWIWDKLPGMMRHRGVWQVYMDHVVDLGRIKGEMEDRGFPVDERERERLGSELEEERGEIDKNIQEIHPDELKLIHPTKQFKDGSVRFGYVKEPPEVKLLWQRWRIAKDKIEKRGGKCKEFEDWVEEKLGLITVETWEGPVDQMLIPGTQPTKRFAKLLPFKASKEQVVTYLNWKRKKLLEEGKRKQADAYTVPLHLKTKRETTGKDELYGIMFKTQDPLIENILEYRSVNKLITNDVKNWMPRMDGRVHSTFGFGPPSGQFSSRRPNILNASKHTKRGPRFRRIVVAPKGRVLIEFDKKSFHVATMGFVAKDASYIRASQIDPHSIFTSWVIGQPIDPAEEEGEIREKISWLKKNWVPPQNMVGIENFTDLRNKQCKHALLGHQNGIGPRKLWWNHRREIESQKRAQELQSMLAGVWPRTVKWQDQIRRKAQLERVLQNEFGRVCYFHEVFSYRFDKRSGKWREYAGSEYNEAVAWPIQSNAFDMMWSELRRLDRRGALDEFGFVNTIHDSLIFMPWEKDAEVCMQVVTEEMGKPCPWLVNEATGEGGLSVRVDVSMGKNWGKWDRDDNPGGMRDVR